MLGIVTAWCSFWPAKLFLLLQTPLCVLHHFIWSGTILSGLIRDESSLWNRSESCTSLHGIFLLSSRQGQSEINSFCFFLASPHRTESTSFSLFFIIINSSKANFVGNSVIPHYAPNIEGYIASICSHMLNKCCMNFIKLALGEVMYAVV